jgi:hypothetical protein
MSTNRYIDKLKAQLAKEIDKRMQFQALFENQVAGNLALLAERDRMAEALSSMTCAYRMAIQAGHARITALGGECDSVERMLADFPDYGKAVALYKSARAALQGEQP